MIIVPYFTIVLFMFYICILKSYLFTNINQYKVDDNNKKLKNLFVCFNLLIYFNLLLNFLTI